MSSVSRHQVVFQFGFSVGGVDVHRRDAESAEQAQRVEGDSSLCAISAFSASLR